MTIQTAALIVAGGRGTRVSSGNDNTLPKQYQMLGKFNILATTLNAFLQHDDIHHVIVVRHADDEALYRETLAQLSSAITATLLEKLQEAAIGGSSRQASVHAGLEALATSGVTHVLIHDAARPFVSEAILDNTLQSLRDEHEAVLVAQPVHDTLKRSQDNKLETVDRSNLWAAQTPQAFPLDFILAAHRQASISHPDQFTDDTAIAEWKGLPITLVEGDIDNFKVTTASDLMRARSVQKMREAETPLSPQDTSDMQDTDTTRSNTPTLSQLGDVRMGTGYDVHAFDDGDAVILGGIAIPHGRKLKGHSDADVVLHAITDAVLGAIGDGDIGTHFPPSDPKWKGAASDQFLIDAIDRVHALGGRVAHVDTTIICEAPKIGPHREALRNSIAEICKLPVSRVSVKATTSEKLGFTGRKEGIASIAAVTVRLPFSEDD